MGRKGESIFKRKDGRYEARYIKNYIGDTARYGYIYGKKRKKLPLVRVNFQYIL